MFWSPVALIAVSPGYLISTLRFSMPPALLPGAHSPRNSRICITSDLAIVLWAAMSSWKKVYGILNISEVKVFGSHIAPSAAPSLFLHPSIEQPKSTIGEAAAVVATWQSTCYWGYALKDIDGNREGLWNKGSSIPICNNGNPW